MYKWQVCPHRGGYRLHCKEHSYGQNKGWGKCLRNLDESQNVPKCSILSLFFISLYLLEGNLLRKLSQLRSKFSSTAFAKEIFMYLLLCTNAVIENWPQNRDKFLK